MIAPRRVLTAAQCLFDAGINNWVKPGSVHFVLGQTGDKYVGHSVVESFLKSPEFAYRLEDRPRWDMIDPKMIRTYLKIPGCCGSGEAFTSDADAVAQRLAVAEYQIEKGVRRVDDDGPRRFGGDVLHQLPAELGRQFCMLPCLRPILRRQSSDLRGGAIGGRVIRGACRRVRGRHRARLSITGTVCMFGRRCADDHRRHRTV